MSRALVLDTNVVIDLLAHIESVDRALAAALEADDAIYLCPFVYYEVQRGFLYRPSPLRERQFRALAQDWHWDDLLWGDWSLGARLWANCRSEGCAQSDADVVIAAFALNRNAAVVTADERAFANLPVPVENWRTED